jgi:hypothetical protein
VWVRVCVLVRLRMRICFLLNGTCVRVRGVMRTCGFADFFPLKRMCVITRACACVCTCCPPQDARMAAVNDAHMQLQQEHLHLLARVGMTLPLPTPAQQAQQAQQLLALSVPTSGPMQFPGLFAAMQQRGPDAQVCLRAAGMPGTHCRLLACCLPAACLLAHCATLCALAFSRRCPCSLPTTPL